MDFHQLTPGSDAQEQNLIKATLQPCAQPEPYLCHPLTLPSLDPIIVAKITNTAAKDLREHAQR